MDTEFLRIMLEEQYEMHCKVITLYHMGSKITYVWYTEYTKKGMSYGKAGRYTSGFL